MFAAELSGVPLAVAVVLLLLFVATLLVHLWAAQRSPREFRAWHYVVAAMSVGFIVGYYILTFTEVPVDQWSETFRFVSLMAVPLVWIVPAILLARQGIATRRTVAHRLQQTDEVERQIERNEDDGRVA